MREAGRISACGFGLVLGGWLLAAAVPAAAQPAAIFSQLESLVPAGTSVVVETIDGRTIKGRVRSLSESALVVDDAGAPAIPLESIRTLSRRVGRRPWLKGLTAGAAAGAGLGLLIIAEDQRDDHACAPGAPSCSTSDAWSAGATAGIITALGAGIGAGVGALIPPPMRVLYRARSSSRVSIAPLVTRRVRGIAVSVAF